MIFLTGNGNIDFSQKLMREVGGVLGAVVVAKFADGEVDVRVEDPVAGREVVIVQSLGAPVNDHLMELMLLADAVRRGGASAITAVVPYLAYARQDRRAEAGSPISARVVADMMESVRITRLVTVDMHSTQGEGFYRIPVVHVEVAGLLAEEAGKVLGGDEVVVVAPDVGGLKRARAAAKVLGCPLASVDKRRVAAGEVAEMNLIGDVAGKHCVLVDDMIDGAGTITAAAKVLKEAGAVAVSAAVTHGLFNGKAVERIAAAGFAHLWVTDTLPMRKEVLALPCVRVVGVSGVVGKVLGFYSQSTLL